MTVAVTRNLAEWIAASNDPPPTRARRAASHAILDWVGVTLAAAGDPELRPLLAEAKEQAGTGGAPVLVASDHYPPAVAARINGTASHLLDFDDVNTRMRGHPTVAILPAIWAAGRDRPGAAIVDALIAGTEIACALGEMMGETHYHRGFHTTATVGTVAAAAGVCRLLGTDAETTARALSLAATEASGLRAVFGTMGKPLHAGLAAERGVMAARWAMAGLSAPQNAIEAVNGFGPVLSESFAPRPIRPDRDRSFGIEDNLFKRHAACYYTHSAIEAARRIAQAAPLDPEAIARVTIGLQPALFDVCDIVEPRTGLEVKFSIRHLVAMALLGRDTSTPGAFCDALAGDETIRALRARITVVQLDTDNRMLSSVTVDRHAAAPVTETHDAGVPETDLDAQEQALVGKFVRLAGPALGDRADDVAARLVAIEAAGSFDAVLAERVAELA